MILRFLIGGLWKPIATQAALLALGAGAAAAAGGPLAQVFNELALVMALMGLAGGSIRGLSLKISMREMCRGAVIGAGLAFGFGILSPPILAAQFGIDIFPDAPTIPLLAATAFVVGYMQDVVTAWMQSKNGKKK